MSVITKDLGVATAYGYAKSKGYTGTEEEFAELMASYADVAQQAEAAAQDAEDAKDEAVTAKTDAQTAKTAAQAAQSAAETASGAASTKASEAAQSAQAASGSATAAQTSATAAAGSAQTAQAAAQTATTKASEASSSASAASTAMTGAETARTGAQTAQAAAETAQENAEEAAASVSASAAQIDQNTADIGQIKNDLNEKADKTEALSAYIVETETGSIASFTDGADDVPVKDLTVAIEPVQSGSGDPSPSNVRPISGWTGANAKRMGKNLFDIEAISYLSVGTISRYGVRFDKPATYAVSAQKSNDNYMYARVFNADGSTKDTYYVISGTTITNATFTISDGEYFIVYHAVDNGKATAIEMFNYWQCQVEIGSSFTTYEPYQGETYEVDWTTEAGTVYGGTLDVTTGLLTVDKVKADLGSMTWGKIADGRFSTDGIKSTVYSYASSELPDMASNWYKTVSYASSWSSNYNVFVQSTGYLYIRDDEYTDSTSFRNALTANNAYIVYKLATTQTYQLTPEEVKTVLGQNNIFADTGNVTVQYRADTKLYIDKVLNA